MEANAFIRLVCTPKRTASNEYVCLQQGSLFWQYIKGFLDRALAKTFGSLNVDATGTEHRTNSIKFIRYNSFIVVCLVCTQHYIRYAYRTIMHDFHPSHFNYARDTVHKSSYYPSDREKKVSTFCVIVICNYFYHSI